MEIILCFLHWYAMKDLSLVLIAPVGEECLELRTFTVHNFTLLPKCSHFERLFFVLHNPIILLSGASCSLDWIKWHSSVFLFVFCWIRCRTGEEQAANLSVLWWQKDRHVEIRIISGWPMVDDNISTPPLIFVANDGVAHKTPSSACCKCLLNDTKRDDNWIQPRRTWKASESV